MASLMLHRHRRTSVLEPTGATLDNDPLTQLRPGGGIYFLNRNEGFRAGRATALIRQKLRLRQIRAAGGAFPPPLVGLPGIPTDGGFTRSTGPVIRCAPTP